VSNSWLFVSETWRLAQVNNGEEFWGAIATLATVGLGWIAYRIARFQLEIDSAPVLIPERVNRTTQIENVGRGVAFEVIALSPDAGATLVAPVLPPNRSVPYPHAAPTIQRSHHVFYRDSLHNWFRMKLVGISFTGHGNFRIGTDVQVWRKRLPPPVQAKRKRVRSAQEHMIAIHTWFSAEWWNLQKLTWFDPSRRWVTRHWFSLGEKRVLRKYERHFGGFPSPLPAPAERKLWDIDLSAVTIPCWHTNSWNITQHSCQRVDHELICRVSLSSDFGNNRTSQQGVVIVTARSWAKLKGDRRQRSDAISKSLAKYICRRSPKTRFACRI